MSSEGIYIGLNGHVKQLANELWGVPFGTRQYILGRFLTEIWKDSATYDEIEAKRAEKVVEEMIKKFNNEGHSGGSACVASQNLLSVMGCNAVSKEEFVGYFRPEESKKIVNTWTLQKKMEDTRC